jgi:hypothetical protein
MSRQEQVKSLQAAEQCLSLSRDRLRARALERHARLRRVHTIWLVTVGALSGVLAQRLGSRFIRAGYATSLGTGVLQLMRVLVKSLASPSGVGPS